MWMGEKQKPRMGKNQKKGIGMGIPVPITALLNIDRNLGGEFNMMSRKVLCAATLPLATQLSGLLTHANYEPEG
jgi:hypothetical protein